jgi:alkanesulfonate monooxygenase SsuD/methylene tetrahydromethanopterin reductase-like flavin-dependent oxidoreductase (luciferase family)
VQVVEVTDDRETIVGDLASQIPGALAADLARTPFLLIGTHEEMAAQLLRQAGELGITSYVVREPAVPPEVPRALRTVHPLGWAIWKGEVFDPSEEEFLTRIQG